MANPVRLPPVPRCLFCLRRIANSDISDLVVPFQRQLRGAKKGKAARVLNVRLLENVQGFGEKGKASNFNCLRVERAPVQESDGAILGAVIPVAPGRMRNIFYPRGVAAYVSKEQLRDLRKREVPIERDFAFGKEQQNVEGDDLITGSVDLIDVIGAYFFDLSTQC